MKIGTNQPTVPLAEQQQAKDITKTPSVQPSGDSYTTENPSGTTDQSPSGLEQPSTSRSGEVAMPSPDVEGLVDAPVPGIKQVQDLKSSLNKIPNFAWTQIENLLNNREALQVILDKPHYATELTERTPEAVQAFREAMDGFVQRGAFEVAVFTGAIGSAGEAMKSLETFLNEQPTARYGLQLGLGNDVSLGQIVSDVRDGTLDEAMLGRFIDGNPTRGDLAVMLTYVREQAGGTMHFDGKSDAMKGFFKSLELPSALHWEHVQSIDVTADKISIAFDESKPLLQKNIFDVNLGSPLEIEMTVDPEKGIALKPKLEGDWALDIIFLKTHLNVTGNALMDTLLELLMKLLLSPVLLVAGLTAEAQDTTIHIESPSKSAPEGA